MTRGQQIQASRKANRNKFDSQTVVINKDWKIIRLDELNWQIVHTFNPEPWNRWYYGSLRAALAGLPDKMLSREDKTSIAEVTGSHRHIIKTIEDSVGKLAADLNNV